MASGGLKRGEKILFGIFALIGVFAVASFVMLEIVRARSDKPMYPNTTHYDFSAEGLRGSVLVRKAGCLSCHRALRNGTSMGLELDGIGSKRSFQYLLGFLKNPEATYSTKTVDHGALPKGAAYVAELPEADLHALAIFLSELRADQGSAVARLPAEGRSGFIDEMVRVWAPDNWKSEYKDVRDEVKQQEDKHDAGAK
ncbi:MAG: c-type cytochrome [Nitrosomonadales bacterium]|nr:c-type cytochrome [Nitrosomonadales bacterium]